jgi:thiol-disulfide isomerase/thioredoxin
VRRIAVIGLAAALLAGCGKDDPPSAAPSAEETAAALKGSPANLASLHDEANKLLGGGEKAFRDRLAELRGHPVVVNKWASWCPPCRSEFPYFQKAAVSRGREVAFLGLNSEDNDDNANKFLAQFPVTYPSYIDPESKLAARIQAGAAFPTTVFFDRKGKLVYAHPGGYTKESDLLEDIERYTK